MSQEYPLHWPAEWPRSKQQTGSQFKATLAGALKNVNDSLRLFGTDSGKKVESVLISSNITLGSQKPVDPGVAIYFTWDGIATCIAVDRYRKVEENLQAIHHCLEAERTKLRHGGLNLVRAAFRGYAALPPPSAKTAGAHWSEIFDVPLDATLPEITKVYKRLRSDAHPDRGGSVEAFDTIEKAYASAKADKSY